MTYSYLKLLHLMAVIIFLGNIFTGVFWMHVAAKTKDLKIIAHTMKGIIKSDNLFTIPGILFITAFGVITAIVGHFRLLHTGWILWSLILFLISGVVFSVKLAPLQRKIHKIASNEQMNKEFDWTGFNKAYSEWKLWGSIALLTPVAALIMMVLKIPH